MDTETASRTGRGGNNRRHRNHRGRGKPNQSADVVASPTAAGHGELASSENKRAPPHQRPKNRGRGRGRGPNRSSANIGGSEKNSSNEGSVNASEKNAEGSKPRNGINRKMHSMKGVTYPDYSSLDECLRRYNSKDPTLIRGKLRVLMEKDGASFCTCDRGSQIKDVLVAGPLERNRALDGDEVFVELLPLEDDANELEETNLNGAENRSDLSEAGESETMDRTRPSSDAWGQDDAVQVHLWDPVVPIRRLYEIPKPPSTMDAQGPIQRQGRVIYVVPPRSISSEIKQKGETGQKPPAAFRRVVGYLKRLHDRTTLLTPRSKSLPQFRLSNSMAEKYKDAPAETIFSAGYTYGSWKPEHTWPPCDKVEQFGLSCNVHDETQALLIENMVDHGEFPTSVLEECQRVVASGEFTDGNESGWKPTPDMYTGRRDYRHRRIFTIDPTTAKDLDDALHIEELPNGQIEVGVHIADVSYFVQPGSMLDIEAQRRCTTVYLVDRTIPMLPRPLCEIACSLNENVERLAFSCVWRMHRDGTMVKGHDIFYGRSVIKSCARLDYSTAQNIIERKVAFGENEINEELWPTSRRPTGGHTIDQVAADVRLMHEVGMARRKLRFKNGALALNAVKLTFKLDADRETPLMFQQYPIRDSNRLVEEYMLLANFLVAQRLITHAGGRALLRNHDMPLYEGMEKVARMAQEFIGFNIDISSSKALQSSLSRLGRECQDELVLKCITEMMKMPMRPATYVAAGSLSNEEWSHFALNIPYYTHFTSPIRRYADVIVHRLLQATLDGHEAVNTFVMSEKEIGTMCERCNDKKEASRKAQDRSDEVFLALYLLRNPLENQLAIVLSVGEKTFTAFIPALGVSALVYLDEHKDWISFESDPGVDDSNRRIRLLRTAPHGNEKWNELTIKNFTRIRVLCKCQDKPPISVKLEIEGPWTGEEVAAGMST